MDLNFGCTQCGRCCRGLRLPLSIDEARQWASNGHRVQLLSEAIPWPAEPPSTDLVATYKRQRSFAARSGSLPVRVIVTPVASFAGDCPNLMAGAQCSIYPQRPAVCRIYPAEINPHLQLLPQAKACPPEAWTKDRPAFLREARLVDADTQTLIDRVRHTAEQDAAAKARLCSLLNIHVAAFANEGFAVHSPDAATLLRALAQCQRTQESNGTPPSGGDWCFLVDDTGLGSELGEIGAEVTMPGAPGSVDVQYLRRQRA